MKAMKRSLAFFLMAVMILLALPYRSFAAEEMKVTLTAQWSGREYGLENDRQAMTKRELQEVLLILSEDGSPVTNYQLEGETSPFTLILPKGSYTLRTDNGAWTPDSLVQKVSRNRESVNLLAAKTEVLSLIMEEKKENGQRERLSGKALEEAQKALALSVKIRITGKETLSSSVSTKLSPKKDRILVNAPLFRESLEVKDNGRSLYVLSDRGERKISDQTVLEVVSRNKKVSLESEFWAPKEAQLTIEGPGLERQDFPRESLLRDLMATGEYTLRLKEEWPRMRLIPLPFAENEGLRIEEGKAILKLSTADRQKVFLALEQNVDLKAMETSSGEELIINTDGASVREVYLLRDGVWNKKPFAVRRDGYVRIREKTPFAPGESLVFRGKMEDGSLTNPLSVEVGPQKQLKGKLETLRAGDRNLTLRADPGLLVRGEWNQKTLEVDGETQWVIPSSGKLVIPLPRELQEKDEIMITLTDRKESLVILDEGKAAVLETVAGEDRYETAVLLSQKTFDQADAVILAHGGVGNLSSPDALAAGPLSQSLDAPILLTRTNKIPNVVLREIERLRPHTLYVTGGEVSVSSRALREIGEMGITIVRLGGEDRYETSALIAKKLLEGRKDAPVILASGESIVDALTINPYAMKEKAPILLSRRESLPEATKKLIESEKVARVTLVGGRNSLSLSLERTLGRKVDFRLAGSDRYDTARRIAQKLSASRAVLAGGFITVDALAAAPYSYQHEAAILLTEKEGLPYGTRQALKDEKYENITVVGGRNVVGEGVYRELQRDFSYQ